MSWEPAAHTVGQAAGGDAREPARGSAGRPDGREPAGGGGRKPARKSAGGGGRNVAAALRELRRRGEDSGRARLRRLRTYLILALQAGLASALAWSISHRLLGTAEPIFAPATAVATIATSLDRRLRRTVELIVGVTIGVAVGDLLIAVIGTGSWQIGVIVALAIMVAVVLRGTAPMINQAGVTAVLIAALSPVIPDIELPRFVNAAIGGLVGLTVVLLLLPLNPLRLVERRATPVLDNLAAQVRQTARALADREPGRAEAALRQLANEGELNRLREAVKAAREVVTYSPVRWSRRGTLRHYEDGIEHAEGVYRETRGLIRRIDTLIREGEPVPGSLTAAVSRFGDAIGELRREFRTGREMEETRACALRSIAEAGHAKAAGLGFHGAAAVAQLRTINHDLLRTTGLDRAQARALVRAAFTR